MEANLLGDKWHAMILVLIPLRGNPLELLGGSSMERLAARFTQSVDVVVFDQHDEKRT